MLANVQIFHADRSNLAIENDACKEDSITDVMALANNMTKIK